MGITTQGYGWLPDLPDFRDLKYALGVTGADVSPALPKAQDLRPLGLLPPVYDQGDLGSCTAHALASLFFFVDRKQTGMSFLPSRLFIYYNERKLENNVAHDSGAQLRTGIKTIVNTGACNEALWPYRPERFADEPDKICYISATKHKASVYRSVLQGQDIQRCLAEGYPVACGITVYESFEGPDVEKTGVLSMPRTTESPVGGHAILLVGYDETGFIAMNSWGAQWGQGGFFHIPYDYVYHPGLATDFWMVHSVA